MSTSTKIEWTRGDDGAAGATLTLAIGRLLGRNPDVDGAAVEGMIVLGVLERSLTHTVGAKMDRMIGTFAPARRKTAVVRQFSEAACVRALPVGGDA
ncbi:hypothetical protein [Candidatus Protofrankia californiensis]|uniref:hypothetical protein n=1 Tax=Candidatus Protofrankia californiensis TaxID=1839754 RepID=UPI00104141F1|nr:hypothetical protein [Candidatus Protofrankia californiensis]